MWEVREYNCLYVYLICSCDTGAVGGITKRESQDYKIRGESEPFKVQRIEICILINC